MVCNLNEENKPSIYLDQAATSFPKAEGVAEAVFDFIKETGVNINRGSYSTAFTSAELVYNVREKICRLFEFSQAKNVIFTPSITYAINFILKGFLKEGDHVLISSMEHNAVIRPLVQLQKARNVSFTEIPCTSKGELLLQSIGELIRPDTKAIIISHASNICGTIIPLKDISEIAVRYHLKLIVDTAQTAGILSISMKEMKIDALAFTGHKGLLGPQGIGGFIISDEMADEMDTIIAGGTGSISDSDEMPGFLPDKFEAGTLNLPGIAGLGAGIDFIEKAGSNQILEHELKLTEQFLKGISSIKGLKLIGMEGKKNRIGVVALQCTYMDASELAYVLDSKHGIMTRVGLHCAPRGHKTLLTYPEGTLRFSFGYYNTEEEVRRTIEALIEILSI